jgi:CBS domain-containing protein
VVYLPEYINFLKNNSIPGKISSEEKEKIKLLLNTKTKDVMTSPCVTIKEDSDVSSFIKLVREKKLKSIPVVDKNKNLAGIITMADVIGLVGVV